MPEHHTIGPVLEKASGFRGGFGFDEGIMGSLQQRATSRVIWVVQTVLAVMASCSTKQ
jgi:hypothetical protein